MRITQKVKNQASYVIDEGLRKGLAGCSALRWLLDQAPTDRSCWSCDDFEDGEFCKTHGEIVPKDYRDEGCDKHFDMGDGIPF